jgi:uncharacterized protein YlaN (UPF0358 family)
MPKPYELPALFDSKGVFQPLAECDLERMTQAQCRAYEEVIRAYDDHRAVERELEAAVKARHRVCAEQREIEYRVSQLPKPTHLDLVRQMSCENR